MKNNSKNRKLKFIREKNYIRKGGVQYNYIKIADNMINDVEFVYGEINRFLQSTKEEINKKYKLNLDYTILQFASGIDGNDFVKGLITIRIKIVRQ
tara:strand:- start:184 stop:471 length:288 start_codon:yes stop_codon:yes gene_type:complete